MLVGHVSDPHFDGTERSFTRATRVVEYLNGLVQSVDLVVVTGDIADHGDPAEYAVARELFGQLEYPVAYVPGNHDERAAFRDFVGSPPAGGAGGDDAPINRVERVGGATFALCDSTIPGRDDGRLDDATVDWLRAIVDHLSEDDPLFVCLHHPPVELHMPFIDRIRLLEPERLADVLRKRTSSTFVLCGHAHSPTATTFGDWPVRVAPGVTSTFVMPWERGDRPIDRDLPPALAMHVLDEGRLTTTYRVIA